MDELDKEFLEAIEAFENEFVDHKCQKVLLADDVLICECCCVGVLEIRETCKEPKNLTEEFLRDHLGMGTGCSTCIKNMPEWKNAIFSSDK